MTLLAGLALAGVLLAQADTPSSKTAADNIAPPPASHSATDAGQISSGGSSAVNAGQISTPASSATASGQISSAGAGSSATTQLSPTVHSTTVAAIRGHDRCDPAAGVSAASADCANTLEQHADQFAPTAEPAPVANTNAPAANLVDDIVNSGTGSVVVAPTPK